MSSTRKLQPRRATCARYGVVSRTVTRWEKDQSLDFPAPDIINGRKYDDVEKLDRWDRLRSGLYQNDAIGMSPEAPA